MTSAAAIKRSYLAEGLTDEQVEALAAVAEVRVYGMGETILHHADEGIDLFILSTGRASVVTPAGDTIATLTPGCLIGEIGLVDRGPRSATVNSLEESRVVILPGAKLKAVVEGDLSLAAKIFLNIAHVLATRLREADVTMGSLIDPTAGMLRKQDVWSF